MSYRSGVLTGILLSALAGVSGWAIWSFAIFKPPPLAKAPLPPPATVPKPLKEEQITSITLTPSAVKRLALRTAPVIRQSMPRTRLYGGEITIPIGEAIWVSAPVCGVLQATPSGPPTPGRPIKKRQPVFQLLPLLTPEGRANLASARIDADGQVNSARTQLDAARIALERTKRVYQNEAGSRRAVDETQAQYDLAKKALDAVSARRDLLDRVVGEVERGTAGPIAIESPDGGIVRAVSAAAGQTVPAGAPLFEVVDLSRVWVRVPVYVGELAEVNSAASAAVSDLAAWRDAAPRCAKPIEAPPAANPLAGTADLVYEMENTNPMLSPGQRVAVRLSLRSQGDSLTLPWSAVIHDIYGGTWVYVKTGDRSFQRQRVGVDYVERTTAVLTEGPAEGAMVVTDGAAELFGAEAGFTK